MEEDDNLLQFAIQQSLLESGNEEDQVGFFSLASSFAHVAATPNSGVTLCMSSDIGLEFARIRRNLDEGKTLKNSPSTGESD